MENAELVLILRFRDLVVPQPGHTVSEHNKIAEKEPYYTWWGWWRKQSEDVPRDLWAKLKAASSAPGSNTYALLLDSGRHLLFRARLHDVEFPSEGEYIEAPEDGERTPDYYQEIAKPAPFASWFKLGKIEQVDESELKKLAYARVPHDEFVTVAEESVLGRKMSGIAQLLKFGNVTYWVGKKAGPDTKEAGPIHSRIPGPIAPKDVLHAEHARILHLTDLHFSDDYHAFEFKNPDVANISLAHAVREAVSDTPPGIVVVSGDLTWSGAKAEFDAAFACLDSIRSTLGLTRQHFIIVPGNHDIAWTRSVDANKRWTRTYEPASADAKENYRSFIERWYGTRFDDSLAVGRRFFVRGGPTIDLLGLNTSALQQIEDHFAGLGCVPKGILDDAAKRLEWHISPRATQLRVMVVHHHVLPVVAYQNPDDAPRGFGIAIDAGRQQERAAHYGVDLLLHGHQHQPYAGYIQSLDFLANDTKPRDALWILGGGSAGVADDHLGPIKFRTFGLVDFSTGEFQVDLYATSTEPTEFRQLSRICSKKGSGWVKNG